MFDKNYFLNQLRNGQNIDTIGQSLADAMNEAVADYEAEQEAAKKAQAECEMNDHKRAIAEDMIDLIKEYGELVAPEAGDILDHVQEEDITMMIKTLDEMFNMMRVMAQLKINLENMDRTKTSSFTKPATKTSKSDDEVLSNFIASLM